MVIQMTNDENIIQIFEYRRDWQKPLSDKDYDKIKDYGDVRITIIRNNTKVPLGIP